MVILRPRLSFDGFNQVNETLLELEVFKKLSTPDVECSILFIDSLFRSLRVMTESHREIKAICAHEILVKPSFLIPEEKLEQRKMKTEDNEHDQRW